MAALMILFVLTGNAPPILLVTLAIMCYLTGYELWKEGDEIPFLWKAWWVLFVLPAQRGRLRDLLDLAGGEARPPRTKAPRPGLALLCSHAVQPDDLEGKLQRQQVLVRQIEP